MAASDDPGQAKALEAQVGHPGDKWEGLKEFVQANAVGNFSAIERNWLDLVWTLDAYRIASVVPRGMGNPKVQPSRRLAAIYRNKGNWYAELLQLLLSNRTAQKLAPRTKVEGFSQLHQIDVAWPDRPMKPMKDPLICLETKVTGGPAFGTTRARGAMSDWSNRRKELKFAATDLKLYRRGQTTEIDHWDVWRVDQMPLCFFLWGARMTPRDNLSRMILEVQAGSAPSSVDSLA